MSPGAISEPIANGVSSKAPYTGPGKELLSPLPQGDHERVLQTYRVFIADLCQQFNMGHPGGAMGMAAIGVALYKYIMRYSPTNPSWFNRDRFVLSNGHTCLFQYMFLHLTGFQQMTFEQLKSYHSDDPSSICPGHPEIEYEGVEVTTGPLGQGVANAVGFAIATKQLAATYNKPGHEVVNNHTWCTIGDACLQEGVAMEAVQLAAHWKLNNLTIIYDNNNISCDGSADMVQTEDLNNKMRAVGWNVLDVWDGNHNVHEIVYALLNARGSKQPTFINVRTTIGYGSMKANTAGSHGAPLGVDNVYNMKKELGLNPDEHFQIPEDVYDFFNVKARGRRLDSDWQDTLARYKQAYPTQAAEFEKRMRGEHLVDWESLLPAKSEIDTKNLATRKGGGKVLSTLIAQMKNLLVGTADLEPSVNLSYADKVDFQSPELVTSSGPNGNYSGRFFHYGVREHAMCSIANGLAAYNHGTFIPITSSFFMFYIYAAAGVRMGALQNLHIIHIATHDSIGAGEDGPTHQPIALAALYRAMPNLLYIRPCDTEEAVGAYAAAIKATTNSSIVSLTRHDVPQWEHSSRAGVAKGAYVFVEDDAAAVTLIGVGAEMVFAMRARDELARRGTKARIVSFPCQRLFEKQDLAYRHSVLRPELIIPTVVIEAYAPHGWERYADAGYSMKGFGKSLPGGIDGPNYKFFDYSGEKIAERVQGLVDEVKEKGLGCLRMDFRDLNGKME